MSDTLNIAGKYYVNLYRDDLKPRKSLVNLRVLGGLLLALLVIAILSRVLLSWQANQLDDAYQLTATEIEHIRLERDYLIVAVRDQRIDPALEQRVTELEQANLGLQRLVDATRLPVEDNSRLYSGLLRDLSSVHQSGLWLSRIENRNGRLRLEGQTSRAGYLPEWMSRFDQVDALRNRQFAVVTLEESDDSSFHFALSSQREVSQRETQQSRESRR